MDRLASVTAMHGFLNSHGGRRSGRHCSSGAGHHHLKGGRSLSLADRRGLISPMRYAARGLISPLPSSRSLCINYYEKPIDIVGHSLNKMHEMSMAMHHDRFGGEEDPISEILMPMKNVKFENSPSSMHWRDMQQPAVSKLMENDHRRSKTVSKSAQERVGELMLSICYLPDLNKIIVSVIRARDLPLKEKFNTSDPYIKLYLVQSGTQLDKRKSTIKPQTISPVYNESFAFNAPPKERLEKDVNIVATVLDYDMIKGSKEIGHVIIGPLGSDTGAKQWKDVIEHHEQPFAVWHKLAPRW